MALDIAPSQTSPVVYLPPPMVGTVPPQHHPQHHNAVETKLPDTLSLQLVVTDVVGVEVAEVVTERN